MTEPIDLFKKTRNHFKYLNFKNKNMAACNFSFPFTGNPDEILNKAKSTVESAGGSFTGDANEGQFHISVMGNTVAGSYMVSGELLNITIDDKPFFVPCSTIEGFLKNKIG